MLLPFLCFPEEVKGRHVVFRIDNMAVLLGLIDCTNLSQSTKSPDVHSELINLERGRECFFGLSQNYYFMVLIKYSK